MLVFLNLIYFLQKISELLSLKTWDEKLSNVTSIISKCTLFPPEQIASAGTSFYRKLDAVNNYKPNSNLKGEITLVKAKDNYVQLGEDYGLTEVSLIFLFF